jgi:hypothetical protein
MIMKKVDLKKVLVGLAAMSILSVMAGCNNTTKNQQPPASSQEMKIENINEASNTFDIVDVRTKKGLSYQKIMINKQKVVSTKCMTMMSSFVIFNYDKISDTGKEIANIGIPEDAVHGYELENGVLNIIVDIPESQDTSDNAQPEKKEEKPTVTFKGGVCEYKSLDYSSEEKRLTVILHYTLSENSGVNVLDVLDKGVIETSEGKTYKSKSSALNREYSLYKLDYHFPDAISRGMSFKYVLNGQEIPIPFGN